MNYKVTNRILGTPSKTTLGLCLRYRQGQFSQNMICQQCSSIQTWYHLTTLQATPTVGLWWSSIGEIAVRTLRMISKKPSYDRYAWSSNLKLKNHDNKTAIVFWFLCLHTIYCVHRCMYARYKYNNIFFFKYNFCFNYLLKVQLLQKYCHYRYKKLIILNYFSL